jgi:hypothetical protein
MCRLPGPAMTNRGDEDNFRGSIPYVSGLAANTNSIFCDGSTEPEAANGWMVLHHAGTTGREAHKHDRLHPLANCALSGARPEIS